MSVVKEGQMSRMWHRGRKGVSGAPRKNQRFGVAGQALITVLAVVTLLAVLPAVIFEATAQHVPITLQAQDSKAALEAADAGVAWYLAMLDENPGFTEYNDITCKATTKVEQEGFYLPSNDCSGVDQAVSPSPAEEPNPPLPSVNHVDAVTTNTQWAKVKSSSGLDESYVFTVDGRNASKGELELIVTGRAGNGPATEYRTIQVSLHNPALSYTIFSNYETSSPYVYTTSEWFNLLMDGVNLLLNSNVAGVGKYQSVVRSVLGEGPVADVKLGDMFCNYYSYQPNPIADVLQSDLVPLISGKLSPMQSFAPLGIPIGQDVYKTIIGAIQDVLNTVFGTGTYTGPFPFVCGANDVYGGYEGINTTISGNVYSHDQLYVCGNENTGASPNLSQANITVGGVGTGSSAPDSVTTSARGVFTQENLFELTLGPYSLGPFGTSGRWHLITGCSNNATPESSRVQATARPTPVPNFDSLQAAAENGGCSYYGPTFIDLEGTDMQVWSPDSAGSSGCPSNGGVASFPSHGVIYVHNQPSSSSCGSFPSNFVLPFGSQDGVANAEPVQHHNCHWGDALVQGTVGGDLTIAASNDIVITGNVTYACSTDGGRQIPVSCADSLGLAPGGDVPLNEPYIGKSGVYYPQGNVTIVHPVVNGENDNNCTTNPTVPDQINGCSASATPPTSPPPLDNGESCGPGFWPWTNTSIQNCIYDIAKYVYNVENSGFYCGLGNQILNIFDLSVLSSCSASDPSSSGLLLNQSTSNPGASSSIPTPRSAPTCTPKYNYDLSSLLGGKLPLGNCTGQWAEYYIHYGMLGGGGIEQVCDFFNVKCDLGYESNLTTYESTWVHGPINSFPAVYDPVIDAMILASNSEPDVATSKKIEEAEGTGTVPQVIPNGSFTVQNVLQGNEWGSGHGLGTMTFVGTVVEQYNDGFSSAGLLTSHLHFFGNVSGCTVMCYEASGFHQVNMSYDPSVIVNPPPYLMSTGQGVGWYEHSEKEYPTGEIITGD